MKRACEQWWMLFGSARSAIPRNRMFAIPCGGRSPLIGAPMEAERAGGYKFARCADTVLSTCSMSSANPAAPSYTSTG